MKLTKLILTFFVLSLISVIKADEAEEVIVGGVTVDGDGKQSEQKGESAAAEDSDTNDKMTTVEETQVRKLAADTTKTDPQVQHISINDQTCTTACFTTFWRLKGECVPPQNKTIQTYQEYCAQDYYKSFGSSGKNLAVQFEPQVFTNEGLISQEKFVQCPDPPKKDDKGKKIECQQLTQFTVSPKYLEPTQVKKPGSKWWVSYQVEKVADTTEKDKDGKDVVKAGNQEPKQIWQGFDDEKDAKAQYDTINNITLCKFLNIMKSESTDVQLVGTYSIQCTEKWYVSYQDEKVADTTEKDKDGKDVKKVANQVANQKWTSFDDEKEAKAQYDQYKGKKAASMLFKNGEVLEKDGDKVLTDSMKTYNVEYQMKLLKDIESFEKLLAKLSNEFGYITIEQFKTYIGTLSTLEKKQKDAILALIGKYETKKAKAKMLYQYKVISVNGDKTLTDSMKLYADKTYPQLINQVLKIQDAWKALKASEKLTEDLNCEKVGERILNCTYDSQIAYKDCAEKCNPKPQHQTFIHLTKKEFCPKLNDAMDHNKLYLDYQAKVQQWKDDKEDAAKQMVILGEMQSKQQLKADQTVNSVTGTEDDDVIVSNDNLPDKAEQKTEAQIQEDIDNQVFMVNAMHVIEDERNTKGRDLHCFPWNDAYNRSPYNISRYTDSDPCFKAFSHGGCCGRVSVLKSSNVTESQIALNNMIEEQGFSTNQCDVSYRCIHANTISKFVKEVNRDYLIKDGDLIYEIKCSSGAITWVVQMVMVAALVVVGV